MNITDIQRQFPSIPWLEYINTILAPTNRITESEVIIINTPQYLHNLETLLSKTPKRYENFITRYTKKYFKSVFVGRRFEFCFTFVNISIIKTIWLVFDTCIYIPSECIRVRQVWRNVLRLKLPEYAYDSARGRN